MGPVAPGIPWCIGGGVWIPPGVSLLGPPKQPTRDCGSACQTISGRRDARGNVDGAAVIYATPEDMRSESQWSFLWEWIEGAALCGSAGFAAITSSGIEVCVGIDADGFGFVVNKKDGVGTGFGPTAGARLVILNNPFKPNPVGSTQSGWSASGNVGGVQVGGGNDGLTVGVGTAGPPVNVSVEQSTVLYRGYWGYGP